MTNAVLHGAEPIVFRADRHDDRVRIEVDDGSTDMGPPSESSRGLDLISRIASAWGVRRHHPGKTVWAEVLLR